MIQVILLICGIGVACRMPKLLRRTASDYPGVDPVKFEAWHRADLRSAIAFLIASWGVLFVQIALGISVGVLGLLLHLEPNTIQGLAVGGGFVLFLIGLLIAGILGSQATRLKKEAGIP